MCRSVEDLSQLSKKLADFCREDNCIPTPICFDQLLQITIHDLPLEMDLKASNARFCGDGELLSKRLNDFFSNLCDNMQLQRNLRIKSQIIHTQEIETFYATIPRGDYIALEIYSCTLIPLQHLPRVFEPFYIKKVLRKYRDGFAHSLLNIFIKNAGGYCDAVNNHEETIYKIYLPVFKENL